MGIYHKHDRMVFLSRHLTNIMKRRKSERYIYYEFFNTSEKELLYENSSNKKKSKKDIRRSTKKKIVEFVPLIIPARVYGEKVDVEVSKKGGKYQLAGGCILTIEEGIFPKATSISSSVVPPNKRSDYAITCEYQSFLVSELFLVCSRVIPKKPISIYIPCVVQPSRFCQLLTCSKIDFNWMPVQDFDLKPAGISFLTETWGIYAIIESSPTEKINVTKQGGLINSHIHPLVSIRIPKLASPIDSECTIQFIHSNAEAVQEIKPCYPNELNNIMNASSMLCCTFPNIQFKRPVTVKIPLPKWALNILEHEDDNKEISDLMLLCKRQGSWDTMETLISYTKNTFSFDTKIFGTFVLLEPRANREGKVKNSLSRLEYANNVVRGAVLVFIWFDLKSWFLWVELAPYFKIEYIRSKREAAGLVFIEQYTPLVNVTPTGSKKGKPANTQTLDCRKSVELSEGMVFNIYLDGDVKFKESSLSSPIVSKQFQKMFYSIINKQNIIPTQGSRRQSVKVDSIHSSEGSDDDFLSKIGVKKESSIKATEKADSITKSQQSMRLIYYSKLEENYRIIEVEPSNKENMASLIVEKWKQKTIMAEDQLKIEAESEIERENNLVDAKRTMQKVKSEDSIQVKSISDSLKYDGPMLKALNKESIARVHLQYPKEEEHTFVALLKIIPEKLSLQIPPNQSDSQAIIDKTLQNEIKIKVLESYIPKNLLECDYEYKFYIEPEEMREYLGMKRPSVNAIGLTREENAEKALNPYLKEVKVEVADKSLLETSKKTALANITSKTNQVITDQTTDLPNTEATSKELKSKGLPAVHKVNDRINMDEIYKEPKVLSSKSLQVLSRYIEHGLTLAVHLGIPDSAITGIGFDSLSANLTLSEVTYKVLIHWKRTILPKDRNEMVPVLVNSLRNMNLILQSECIQLAAQRNEELTREYFKTIPELTQIVFKDSAESRSFESTSTEKTSLKEVKDS